MLEIKICFTLLFAGDCIPPNVALISNGAQCLASSETREQYRCENALDGSLVLVQSEWATHWEGVDSWLDVIFDQTYT